MIIVDNFEEILIKEKLGSKVTEKLAGNTPKSALLFYNFFKQDLEYKVLNLGDSSKAYFRRAEELAKEWNLDFESFKKTFSYNAFVNVYNKPVYEFNNNQDVIMYWGAAMKCLQTFEGDREQNYLDIIEEERIKGLFQKLTDLEVHDNIRKRHRNECFKPITDKELCNVIENDFLSLNSKGVIITNQSKDTAQIRRILFSYNLKPLNYFFIKPLEEFLPYERFLTIWRQPKHL
ncbi:MAG: hypothetical protein KKF52_04265 [Nanoarchaeota archaeon]|nr:hypothetical protein [Nanoarchaeota archaeon]MBU4351667.1 hypothetical protein [Nanoarchaeota archaeon]